jgi:hypothetical protein
MNQLKTETDVLKKIFAVNLNVNIWSAKTKLKPEDFSHGTLPPGDLASLGTKRICDPSALKIFGTLKSRAITLLDKSGIRFLGGWAIPESKAQEINAELEHISKEFLQAKLDFLKGYDIAVNNWIAQNSAWKDLIANSTVSSEYVADRIGFHWQVFQVLCPAGKRRERLCDGLTSEVEHLSHNLFDDVSKTAKDSWNKSFLGKNEVTRKALAPLKGMQQKLSDLSFIEPKVMPVVNLIQDALDRIPKRGVISDMTLLMIKRLISLLQDKAALIKYAQNILDGVIEVGTILDDLVQTEAPLVLPKLVESTEEVAKVKTSKKEVKKNTLQLDSHGLW